MSRKLETPKEITLETKSALWAKCVQLEAFTQLIMVGEQEELTPRMFDFRHVLRRFLSRLIWIYGRIRAAMDVHQHKNVLSSLNFSCFTAVCVGNGTWLVAAGTPKGERLLQPKRSNSRRSTSRKRKAKLRLWNRSFWKLLLSFNADSN